MTNSLAIKINYSSLLKFTGPSMVMMLFMSFYTMVDGIFVSRFVNTQALSAVNIVYPLISVVVALGVMLATGGGAIIAKNMGENQMELAKARFTFAILSGIVIGGIVTVCALLFIDPIIRFLGANDAIYAYCYDYFSLMSIFVIPSMLQMLFQTLFVTAGKPNLGLIFTVLGGVCNVVFDYVLIVNFEMGISGAAIATGISYCIPAVFGLFYFSLNKKSLLRFSKFKVDFKFLRAACFNGSSEMVTNLSTAVTTLLFNIIMMKLLGEDGVAAITIILYAQFFLIALYLGYSMGVAPLISFAYGTQDKDRLKKLFKKSVVIVSISSVVCVAIAMLFAGPIVTVFAPQGTKAYDIAIYGMYIFSIAYLFMGYNILASAFFTALNNGKISAILSFLRTFLFLSSMIMLLPMILGVTGVWLSVVVAEFLALIVSAILVVKKSKTYGYF